MTRKSFNEKLHDSKDMPKIVEITDDNSIKRYGGCQMILAPPLVYNGIMAQVPEGKVITVKQIREYLADKHGADFTDPMTAGIFISLSAQASCERECDRIPFWRTLSGGGVESEISWWSRTPKGEIGIRRPYIYNKRSQKYKVFC